MTQRLYYLEPGRQQFQATVTACEPRDGQFIVMLDQTAFYPSSGGQPFDTGTLGGARVSDVRDREDGDIDHVVDGPVAVGSLVTGVIDWPRRFDHMQQHSGQHVLSAVYDRLFGVRTESFHLGSAAATIDLSREVTPAEIHEAEHDANRVVWGDRRVSIRFASAEEAAAVPLRKEPARDGTIRLIEIDGVDVSACGGTHVARTGEIGIITTTRWEKVRGGTRVEFLCGGRVLERFRVFRDALAATARHLSVAPTDLAGAIEGLQTNAKSLQRTIRGLQEQLAVHEARSLVERAVPVAGRLVVAEVLDGWDAAGLKMLAMAVVNAAPAAAVVLFSTTNPALVVVARGADGGVDAAALLKGLLAAFGGKGGGKGDLAQGGGLIAPAEHLLAHARSLLGQPSA
ncbi:MAG: alanyl-tRNA editing protein [Acidobacteriota bacterium]